MSIDERKNENENATNTPRPENQDDQITDLPNPDQVEKDAQVKGGAVTRQVMLEP
jgi:hypothetical protein